MPNVRSSMKRLKSNPIRFRDAWQGIRALDSTIPDDTGQVFKIIRALSKATPVSGNSRRFLASEHGPTILAEKRSLLERLSDREYLESTLPVGRLAWTCLCGLSRKARTDFTSQGLVEASESAFPKTISRFRQIACSIRPCECVTATTSGMW